MTPKPPLTDAASALSNLVSNESPRGGEGGLPRCWNSWAAADFGAEGFLPRDHVELGAVGRLGRRACRQVREWFFYLTGPGALLELALLNLAMRQAVGEDSCRSSRRTWSNLLPWRYRLPWSGRRERLPVGSRRHVSGGTAEVPCRSAL